MCAMTILDSRFHETVRKSTFSNSPHDVVVDLHEGCGSIEPAQICVHHFSGAHAE